MTEAIVLSSIPSHEIVPQGEEAPAQRAAESHGCSGTFELGDTLSAPLNVVEVEDVPPDRGYGWVCTLCVFIINANTWGVNSVWGIFLAKYLSDSTFPGHLSSSMPSLEDSRYLSLS